MVFAGTFPGRCRSGLRPRCRPEFEPLEGRDLLSNILVLDFTPTRMPGETQRPTSFLSDFRQTQGRPPHFLDFNHNHRVNGADGALAVQEIVQRVDAYFQGYDLVVQAGDVGQDAHLGPTLLSQHAAGDHVYVLFVGGQSFDGSSSTFGEAFQAPVGTNLEYYGFAFSGSMVRWYQHHTPQAAPEYFAQDVALSVAHEFGHLLGLGHVAGNPLGDPNPMNYNVDPVTAFFPDKTYPAIELRDANMNPYWGPQNPAAELRMSFAGQPAADSSGLIYSGGGGAHRGALDRVKAPEVEGRHERHRPALDAASAGTGGARSRVRRAESPGRRRDSA